MKLKNYWKRFWTLDRHHAAGFTLVELIVVIAILAILAGVAIPVYSGYIKKANMQADQTLAAEIADSLTLAYYSGDLTKNGYVILSATNGPDCGANPEVQNALEATFGSNSISTLTLKYDGWSIDYAESSFAGSETELLGKVDNLTGLLGSVLDEYPELMGPRFIAYLDTLELDPANPEDATAISQAAVLYVAQNMGNANKTDWVDSVANLPNAQVGNAAQICDLWLPLFNGSYLDVAAALYATAEAYCRYEQNVHGMPEPMKVLDEGMSKIDPEKVTDGATAVNQVWDAFAAVQNLVLGDERDNYHFYEYFSCGQARKDAEAYVGIMNTVSGAESAITGSLGQENCFSSAELSEMFNVYSQGGVIIVAEIQNDGSLIVNNPLALE